MIHEVLTGLRNMLYGLVLHFFRVVHRNIGSKLTAWYMEDETTEHFRLLTKVFITIILPTSVAYFFSSIYFLGKNSLSSIIWNVGIFFYSQFLPDLPSTFSRSKTKDTTQRRRGYKKYVPLLFAPLLVFLLFSGTRFTFETSDTFHDFRSAAIYTVFLLVCSFFAFGNPRFTLFDAAKVISFPLYGLAGYLTHLKVDRIW